MSKLFLSKQGHQELCFDRFKSKFGSKLVSLSFLKLRTKSDAFTNEHIVLFMNDIFYYDFNTLSGLSEPKKTKIH